MCGTDTQISIVIYLFTLVFFLSTIPSKYPLPPLFFYSPLLFLLF